MAGTLLDIYDAYDSALRDFQREAQQWNDLYVGKTFGSQAEYDAAMAAQPTEPLLPPGYDQYQQDQQAYTDGQPQELYQTAFGRATPDVMTNEAWSLNNISSPFMSNAPATAYETGGVAQINNPLYTLEPNALTTGQKEDVRNSTIAGLNTFY